MEVSDSESRRKELGLLVQKGERPGFCLCLVALVWFALVWLVELLVGYLVWLMVRLVDLFSWLGYRIVFVVLFCGVCSIGERFCESQYAFMLLFWRSCLSYLIHPTSLYIATQ